MKQVQLTISGCLGPCDIPNVVCVTTPQGTEWYGNMTCDDEYETLLDWAQRCADANSLLPLPEELQAKRFRRWQE